MFWGIAFDHAVPHTQPMDKTLQHFTFLRVMLRIRQQMDKAWEDKRWADACLMAEFAGRMSAEFYPGMSFTKELGK